MNALLVRCPYCASGDEFRPMVALSDGRFICGQCGHLAFPNDRNFECACRKCFERPLDTQYLHLCVSSYQAELNSSRRATAREDTLRLSVVYSFSVCDDGPCGGRTFGL